MIDRIVKIVAHVLEIILSLMVLVAVLVGIVFLYKPFMAFLNSGGDSAELMNFLGQVLAVAIGLEFFRVLYKPQIQILLEVLVFVIARHMIVHELSAIEDLIAIIGISIIVVVRYFVFTRKKKDPEEAQEHIVQEEE